MIIHRTTDAHLRCETRDPCKMCETYLKLINVAPHILSPFVHRGGGGVRSPWVQYGPNNVYRERELTKQNNRGIWYAVINKINMYFKEEKTPTQQKYETLEMFWVFFCVHVTFYFCIYSRIPAILNSRTATLSR